MAPRERVDPRVPPAPLVTVVRFDSSGSCEFEDTV